MTKRKFKEELLQALAPEIYGPSDNLTKRDIKHVKKREKKRKKLPRRQQTASSLCAHLRPDVGYSGRDGK